MVKQYLNGKGHSYEEVNLDANPDRWAEMRNYTVQTTVPLVIVQDDAQPAAMPKMMQGFNIAKLAEAVA